MCVKFLLFCTIGLLGMSCHTRKYIVENDKRENIKIINTISQDSILVELRTYKDSLHKTVDHIIGKSVEVMSKGKPNSTLGNLFCDAIMAYAQQQSIQIDATISNHGGIRLNALATGNITVGKIYELSPFENFLTIVEIKGNILQEWADLIASKGGDPVAGINFTIKDKKAIDITINKIPLNAQQTYFIATNDYLAMGNDGCVFLKDKPNKIFPITIRDCIMQYIKSQQTIIPNPNQPIH